MRIYEINTAVFLAGRRLEEVVWDFLPPVDAVWLMGAWERSPSGLEIARGNAELMAGMRAALPDLRDEDVIGSPYCVRDYVVDPRFGSLEAAREALAARGLKLILDYVPHHVAPDHPWLSRGGRRAAAAAGRHVRRPALRHGDADDQRGHRAHLGLTPPAEECWPAVLRDDLVFIAEAYWDMEYTLQQQGFDYCYDKRLYDRLAHEDAASVRGHLRPTSPRRLEDVTGWPDNDTCRNLVAWSRPGHPVVVNLSDAPAQGVVAIASGEWTLTDPPSGARLERSGGELYVALDPWGSHYLQFEP